MTCGNNILCCEQDKTSTTCIRIGIYFFDCCEARAYIYVSAQTPRLIKEVRCNGSIVATNINAVEWGGLPLTPPVAQIYRGPDEGTVDITGRESGYGRACGSCGDPFRDPPMGLPPTPNCQYQVEVELDDGSVETCSTFYCLGRQVVPRDWDWPGISIAPSCTFTNDDVAGGLTATVTHEVEIDAVAAPDLSIDYCIGHPEDRHYTLANNHRIREAWDNNTTFFGGHSAWRSDATYTGELVMTIPGYNSCRQFGGNYMEWLLTFIGTATVTTDASSQSPGDPPWSYHGTETYSYVRVVGRIWMPMCGTPAEIVWWWFYFSRFHDPFTFPSFGCVPFEPIIQVHGTASWCG